MIDGEEGRDEDNGDAPESTLEEVLFELPGAPGTEPARSLWTRLKATFFGSVERGLGSIGVLLAAVGIVLAVALSSGGGGKAKPIVINGATVAVPPSAAKSAVEEIAQRDIWSAAPITVQATPQLEC
jgi:hypothetical protein